MKFFIDTAGLSEIREAAGYGFLDGVTTNPTLLAREKVRDAGEHIRQICALTPGPVSAEVTAMDAPGMAEEGRRLAALAPNVVIKLPLTMPGLAACRMLSAEGIAVNATLVFSAVQALLAAKSGAAYVSPFVGRLDENGTDGMRLVEEILGIYRNYGYKTEVIVASIRHPQHVLRAALAGAHICTIPFAVLGKLASHPLTDKGLETFLADWKKNAG
jgi:transaldolase